MSEQDIQWRSSHSPADATADTASPGGGGSTRPGTADSNLSPEQAAILQRVDDPAVLSLLTRGAVSWDAVANAVRTRQPDRPLWRTLIKEPSVPRTEIFREVATLAGHEAVEINAYEPADDLVRSILGLFGDQTIELILRAGLIPTEILADANVDEFTLVFATYDPTNMAVQAIAASLGVGTSLRYADENVVQARIAALGFHFEQDTNGSESKTVDPTEQPEPPEENHVVESTPAPIDDTIASTYPVGTEPAESDVTDVLDGGDERDIPASHTVATWEWEAEPPTDGTTPDNSEEYEGEDDPFAVTSRRDSPKSIPPTPETDPWMNGDTAETDSTSNELDDSLSTIWPAGVEGSGVTGEMIDVPDSELTTDSLFHGLFEADDEDDGKAIADETAQPPIDRTAQLHVDDDTASWVEPLVPGAPAVDYTPISPTREVVDPPSRDGEIGAQSQLTAEPDPVLDISVDPVLANPEETAAATTSDRTAVEDDPVAGAVFEPVVTDSSGIESIEGIVAGPTADTSLDDTKANQQSAVSMQDAPRDRVVVMLLHKQLVTQEQVDKALEVQKENPKEALWRLLAQVSGVDREAVYEEAAAVYAFPTANITEPDPNFARLVMEAFPEERREKLLELGLFPIEYDVDSASGGAKLVFATHDPARPDVHRTLQQLKLGRFEIHYASQSTVAGLIHETFPRRNEFLDRMTDDPFAMDLGTSFEEKAELIDEDALEAEISRSTLINLFEATLMEATRQGASDIHIFPNRNRKVEIHFRTDGRLKRWHVEDKVHPEAFLAVVKDNSTNIDRFERDAAQDGFIQRRIDDALIRFRVSVLPIATASQEIRAESIVIRVLDDRKVLTDLRKLGMLDVALERFDRAIRQPHGMVILTGPTGSGKSTTLVAALHQVVTPEINVLTVEDPVEYIIRDVRQIKLSHKLNLDGAMRSILRHDPDVVMVGEMRDRATADLAIKLANTGHLTFSTLHTNDAPSAVSRLFKMGVEPFLIAYAINLIVAQRLLRNLCPECKSIDHDPDAVMLKSIGFTDDDIDSLTFFKANHDRSCRTCRGIGYKGRRAMCETLYFSREIRHMIVQSGEEVDEDAIRQQAVKEGMLTLLDSAREIVRMGETSVEELLRVTSSE